MNKLLFIVGTGGVGKSPLDKMFGDDVIRINPVRFRQTGPRDKYDQFYAPPSLRKDILKLVDNERNIKYGKHNWFPDQRLLDMEINGVKQIVFFPLLNSNSSRLVKVEIFAPLIPLLLTELQLGELMNAKSNVIVLNPSDTTFSENKSIESIKRITGKICEQRGDSIKDIRIRLESVKTEIEAWKEIKRMHEVNMTEYLKWRFTDYTFWHTLESRKISVSEKINFLDDLRKTLIAENYWLEEYLKTDFDFIDR